MASASAGDKKITGHLKRIIGNPVGQLIPLFESDVSVGRTKKSDLCIQDPNVSRSHCTLNYSTDGWFITDLGGVNGTYLDGDKLTPHISYPLKDGLGIYLGPPSEAPVAFVFIKNKVEEAKKMNLVLSQNKTESNKKTEDQSQSDQPTLKRRVKPNTDSTRSKKHAPSTSSNMPVSSQNTTDGENSDNGNNSDVSICSLDSLRTRIRKINNSERKKKRPSSNIDSVKAASSSTSLSSRPPANNPTFNSIPSTSSAHQVNLRSASSGVSKKLMKSLKSTDTNMFKELDTLFTDGSDSLPDTANANEDSESLLSEVNLSNGLNEPASNIAQLKKKMADLNEQLKKAHHKLMLENHEQKQKLNQFMEESTNKTEPSEKLGQMIEEELICNICTEVFIKATTLGCSHTYCEHCIKEWKKKQKRCPICRELIVSETRILIMDNFIDKVVSKLDKEYQDKRKGVIAAREEAMAKEKVKKTKKKKSSNYRRNAIRARVTARDNPDALRQLRLDLLDEVPYHVIDITTSENLSVGEYFDGSCYICGEDGHYASYCPHS